LCGGGAAELREAGDLHAVRRQAGAVEAGPGGALFGRGRRGADEDAECEDGGQEA
jgi:hypothetical protein